MRVRIFFILLLLPLRLLYAGIPLWEVSGNGLKKPSYLFGAGAMQPAALANSVSGFNKAFDASELLVVESTTTPRDYMTKLRSYGMMKDQKIKQLVSDTDYHRVDKELKNNITIGLFFLGSLKPATISMIICSSWLKDSFKNHKEDFLIKGLMAKAKKEMKEIYPLESSEEQMDMMLNKGTMEEQASILVRMLDRKTSVIDAYRKSTSCYERGDFEGMARLGLSNPLPYSMTSEGLHQMISGRNVVWVRKIINLIKTKSAFIVVNPSQIVFEDGLISLLEKEGYTVKELNR